MLFSNTRKCGTLSWIKVLFGKQTRPELPGVEPQGTRIRPTIAQDAGAQGTMQVTTIVIMLGPFRDWPVSPAGPGRAAKRRGRAAGQLRSGNATALAVNVVFKFVDNEFLLRDYTFEQIADRDNSHHFVAFEHRQMPHTLLSHQSHA